MLIETQNLTEKALDWAVAKAVGLAVSDRATAWRNANHPHNFSSDWALSGPIIDREKIELRPIDSELHPMNGMWMAQYGRIQDSRTVEWFRFDALKSEKADCGYFDGATALVAALRCFVGSKLGFKVEVPDYAV